MEPGTGSAEETVPDLTANFFSARKSLKQRSSCPKCARSYSWPAALPGRLAEAIGVLRVLSFIREKQRTSQQLHAFYMQGPVLVEASPFIDPENLGGGNDLVTLCVLTGRLASCASLAEADRLSPS